MEFRRAGWMRVCAIGLFAFFALLALWPLMLFLEPGWTNLRQANTGLLVIMGVLLPLSWAVGLGFGLHLLRLSADIRVDDEALSAFLYGVRVAAMRWRDVVRITRQTGASHGVYGSTIKLHAKRRTLRFGEGFPNQADLIDLINKQISARAIPAFEFADKTNAITPGQIVAFVTAHGVRATPVDKRTVRVDRLTATGPRP
jgi:hypothetical protein